MSGAMQVHAGVAAAGFASDGFTSKSRLIQAAHEFEGQMLKELLKPLTASDGLMGEAGESEGGEILGEFGAEALGKALSERGGFGIANRIVGQLSQTGNHAGTVAVTGNRRFDTGINAFQSLE